jgi:hypothetical protein
MNATKPDLEQFQEAIMSAGVDTLSSIVEKRNEYLREQVRDMGVTDETIKYFTTMPPHEQLSAANEVLQKEIGLL